MSNKKFSFSSTKGYYIALVLCAVAIGISGYLYYRNANHNDARLQNPDATVGATAPNGNDVAAVATQPQQNRPTKPVPTVPTAPQTEHKPIKTAVPLEGQTVAVYAMDSLSYNETTRDWRVHNGIDIAAEEGTNVCAAADGTVYTVYEDEKMGTTVVIRHENGYTTQYASLASGVPVKAGDTVKLGQTIGTVGNSALLESAVGAHLHFSVTQNDKPVDPQTFLSQK